MSCWYRVVLPMTLAACQGASVPPATPAAAPPVRDATTMDELVDAGGLSLHIRCVGDGAPVVVLDAGLGDDASVWSEIQPELGRFARTCAYDRAGTGKSGGAPRPHGSRQMVSDLHALLGRAGIEGPYVLVGHSFGGLNVRLYASEHGSEVTGMVLVDATTEEQDTRFWSLIPEEAMRGFRASLTRHPEGLDFEAYLASLKEVRESKRSLGDMPLVVLSHGKEGPPPPGGAPDLGAQLARAWREMQSDLPRLSSNSVHVTAVNSGHSIHKDAPRLVIAAVQAVVKAVRSGGRVDGNELSALAGEGASD